MSDAVNNRFSAGKLKFIPGLLVCGVIGIGLALRILGAGETDQNQTFKLREVSVFDPGKDDFIRGQMCRCQDKPFPEVKTHPAFVSQVPIFGSIRFGGRPNETNSGLLFYFAVDESSGTGKGYDEFASIRNFDFQEPQQDFFLVAPERGVIASWPIFVEEKQKPFQPA